MKEQVYRIMDDETLARTVRELERVMSQDAFANAPDAARVGYIDALDAARSEAQRRVA